MTEKTHLDWTGPFELSKMEAAVDQADGKVGVYLLTQKLDRRPSVYVGSSTNIGARFRSHIKGTLALDYYILEDEDDWHPKRPPPAAFWSRVSDLRSEMGRCVTALEATSFAWAEATADRINTIERAIYARLRERQNEGALVVHNGAAIGKTAGQVESVNVENSGAREVCDVIGLRLSFPVR